MGRGQDLQRFLQLLGAPGGAERISCAFTRPLNGIDSGHVCWGSGFLVSGFRVAECSLEAKLNECVLADPLRVVNSPESAGIPLKWGHRPNHQPGGYESWANITH